MENVKAALIGVGVRGMSHARAIAAAPNIEFVAICDIDEEVGQPAAEEFGVQYMPNTKEVYARDDIQAVGICVQTPVHYELAMEAIEAGRHLLTEKPMAASVAQAKEMRDAAREAGVRAAISYQVRLSPVMRKMKEICEQINPLQVLFARQRAMMHEKYLSPKPFDGIMDFVSHDIDMVPYLAGRTPTAVFTTTRRDTWSRTGAIDVIGVQIEMDDGDGKAIGYISSSMGGGGVPQRLDIVGDNGFAVAAGNTITFSTDPNPEFQAPARDVFSITYEGEGRDSTRDLYEHWAACVLDPGLDLAPVASYDDGYNALLLSLAIVSKTARCRVVSRGALLRSSGTPPRATFSMPCSSN